MKISIISVIVLLISLSVGNFKAQDHQAETEDIKERLSEDVTIAAEKANIGDSASLIEAFIDVGFSQIGSFRQVYASIPKNEREERLARYLTAKAKIGGIPANVTTNDLGDFHWGYIATDTKYSSLRLDSSKAAKLVRIESASGIYDFFAKGEGIQPGTDILMPVVFGQENASVSATFELGDQKALWTGNLTEDVLKIVDAKTSEGCEIFVNSKPPQATVYFNGRKWYDPTNTSAIRDPGLWEVRIHLEGHKEWREERNLLAGESWIINALLLKQ